MADVVNSKAEALRELATELAACQTCGKEHQPIPVAQPAGWPSQRPHAPTWASPDDGHAYQPGRSFWNEPGSLVDSLRRRADRIEDDDGS